MAWTIRDEVPRIGGIDVLVVLPTYNEAANIFEVIRRLHRACPDAQVLVIDDSSPDGTAEVAGGIAAEIDQVELLLRPTKSGLGSAYREGFRRGLADGYDAVVEMDSDLSHSPEALPTLLAELDSPNSQSADLVIGSRYVPGGSIPAWSRHRRFLSRWANRYTALMLGNRIGDSTSGFRVYRSTVLAAIDLNAVRTSGYAFQIEMVRRVLAAAARLLKYRSPLVSVHRAIRRCPVRSCWKPWPG